MTAEPLPVLIARRAFETPDAPYLTEVDGPAKTFADVHREALTWAQLLANSGVTKGDRVCSMLPTSSASIETWMGIAWLGAWEVPINTAYIGDMLQYIINNSQAHVMIIDERYLPALTEVAGQLEHLEKLVVLQPNPAADALGLEVIDATAEFARISPLEPTFTPQVWDICSVMYTSGTTGPSKGVMVPWGQLTATGEGTFPADAITSDDCLYWPFPMFHVSGKNGVQIAAAEGVGLVIREQFKTDQFMSDIAKFGCTVTMLLGAMANFLVRTEPSPQDSQTSLEKVIIVPTIDDLAAFQERFAVKVCTVFNMTETSVPLASNGWIPGDSLTCGTARPGYTLRLVDENDNEVPDGTLGELAIRSDTPWTQMIGYFNMPEATLKATRNQWLHTGDGFVKDPDTGEYTFVDRQKDAIRRRGENISSFEVEASVNQHPDVFESAAVAVPSEFGEDEIMLVVSAKEGRTLEPAEIHAFCSKRLPRFMVPRYVRIVDELPKTPTQKIQKGRLRERGLDSDVWDSQA